MKKIIFLLSILISFSANSQCVIDGQTVIGTTRAKIVKSCDAVVQSLSNGLVKSVGDTLKTATPGIDYASLDFTLWDNTKQYAIGNTVLFDNNIYTANATPTLGDNPGGNADWTLQVINVTTYSGPGAWTGIFRAPTMWNVGSVFDAIYDSLANIHTGGAFLPLAGGTVEDSASQPSISTVSRTLYGEWSTPSGNFSFGGNNIKGWSELWDPGNVVAITAVRQLYGGWVVADGPYTDSLSVAVFSQLPISGSFSGTGTATTTFTVTLPVVMPNNTYIVNATPTSTLALGFLVNNKTTSTFDYVVPAATGTVTFDYAIFR
jgi:hypothetical protein